MRRIKQFGLERTGTNYTRFLLQENFEVVVEMHVGRWKHATVPLDRLADYDHLLVNVKHPFAWCASYLKFYRNLSTNVHVLHPIVRLWAAFNDYYLALTRTHPDKVSIMRFEDLLLDGQRALAPVVAKLALVRKSELWQDSPNVVTPAKLETHTLISHRPFDKAYYADRRYMDIYTPKSLNILTSFLQRECGELLDEFGYKLET